MSILNLFKSTQNEVEEWLQKGIAAHHNQQLNDSIQYIEKALDAVHDKTPKRVKKMLLPATITLADSYFSLEKFQQALACYQSALNLAKTDMEKMNIHESLGKVCYLLGDFEGATTHYLQSLSYASKNTPKESIKTVHSSLLHQLGHVLLDNHPKITDEQSQQAKEYVKYLKDQENSYNLTQLNYYRELGVDLWNEYNRLR